MPTNGRPARFRSAPTGIRVPKGPPRAQRARPAGHVVLVAVTGIEPVVAERTLKLLVAVTGIEPVTYGL